MVAGTVGVVPSCVRVYRRREPEGTLLHGAVRENLATLVAEAAEVGRGLPRYVERDFSEYLECGVLAHGFARVRCEGCKDEVLVAFSCKGRGVCPSCNAKRAHVTAAHLVEEVLPRVPWCQWTVSFPVRVRWVLARDAGLLSDVLTVFLRALFALQRRRARRLGIRGGQTGAVSFVQRFGSALQLTPHFHSLLPDGVFVAREGGASFEELPPPSQLEVERLLEVVHRRTLRLLAARGVLPAGGPEDALEAYQAANLQQRFRFRELDVRPPPRQQPRCAFLEGFSLHANTHLHAHDRVGLERLCRYGARGALALERFEKAPDGRIAYRLKRLLPDGSTHLLFTGLELLRRVASLIPPPRSNLVRFHGVFAPGAKLRPFLLPRAGALEVLEAPAARQEEASSPQEGQQRRRRWTLDWAALLKKTFGVDVYRCPECGGRRRVLACLTSAGAVGAVLRHLELPSVAPPLAPARGPPQLAWVG